MLGVHYRRAQRADAAALSELGAATFTDSYAAILPARDISEYTAAVFSRTRVESEIADADIVQFVAEYDGALVGYAKLRQTEPPSAILSQELPAIEFERLYVAGRHKGQGTGTELLKRGLEEARARLYRTCWLRVWEGNEHAIAFYIRKGFLKFGTQSYAVGGCARPVFLMRRPLAKARS